MTILLMLVPVEYRDGLVIQPIPSKPITTHSLEASTAQGIIDAARRMQSAYDGTHDAKVGLIASGRKVRGFDSIVKPALRNMYCHRNPVWQAVN